MNFRNAFFYISKVLSCATFIGGAACGPGIVSSGEPLTPVANNDVSSEPSVANSDASQVVLGSGQSEEREVRDDTEGSLGSTERYLKSGDRLKPQILKTPGGAERFVSWYDTELETSCTLRRTAEYVSGKAVYRCLPAAIAVLESIDFKYGWDLYAVDGTRLRGRAQGYSDSACELRVETVFRPSTTRLEAERGGCFPQFAHDVHTRACGVAGLWFRVLGSAERLFVHLSESGQRRCVEVDRESDPAAYDHLLMATVVVEPMDEREFAEASVETRE